MINNPEPLLRSKSSILMVHDLFLDRKSIRYIDLGYIQKDEVKKFRKFNKRKLSMSKPYVTQLYIDSKGAGLTEEKIGNCLHKILSIMKENFKSFNRDFFTLRLIAEIKKKICKYYNL